MHTPGPWTFDPSAEADGRRSGYIRGPKSNGAGGLIAVARVTEAGNGHSERMANARLIAAAPSLAAALIRCLDCLGPDDTIEECEEARSALRRAGLR